MVGKEVEIIVLLLPLCYTIKEVRAASAMTRLEAHFFQEGAAGKGQKTIRAANGILKPRKIRACKTRISEHEPRKGTETSLFLPPLLPLSLNFRTRISKEDGTGYDFLLMKSQPVVYVLSLQCILLMLNWQKRG